MIKTVIKRNGKKVAFDKTRIINAVLHAFLAINDSVDSYALEKATQISNYIENLDREEISVEEIQDLVENGLMNLKDKEYARAYMNYRREKQILRDTKQLDEVLDEITNGNSEYWSRENSNKNAKLVTTQRDYIAGAVSTDIALKKMLPQKLAEAHRDGVIHVHDLDYWAQNTLANCCLVNLNDMLQNGTILNGVKIDKPHRILTAMTIATQIILGVSSSQWGGVTISLTHLAPFVRDSYNYYLNFYKEQGIPDNLIETVSKASLKKEVESAVQTLNYQINSQVTVNGMSWPL